MIDTKINPENVDISTILSNPTPTSPKAKDEASAKRPMIGYTIMAKMMLTMKL